MKILKIIAIMLIGGLIMTASTAAAKTSDAKSGTLYVTIVWNQHQPMYKDARTGEYDLPWVRLHGVKSYYAMAAYLEDYDDARGVFNLTPSLLEQITDYENGVKDKYFKISEKPAAMLSTEEKRFMKNNFYVYPRNVRESEMPAFKRLRELKRNSGSSVVDFSSQQWTDLQLLHNLAWINPMLRDNDEKLSELLKKDGNFTDDEKQYVLNFHMDIMKKIIPEHKKLQENGKAELITTPYYHPILPLLIDTNAGRRPSPNIPMPEYRFQHPEDAEWHVKRALEQYDELYGGEPVGMWPAEQAVSHECVPVFAGQGIEWIVTDENVLSASLDMKLRGESGTDINPKPENEIYVTGNASDNLLHPELLYKPWRVENEGKNIVVLFRDQNLSDKIGFVYTSMGDEIAAKDLVSRLENIQESLEGDGGPYLLTIALDGENCWEHYEDDSRTFMNTLYAGLEGREDIKMTTPAQYLKQAEASRLENEKEERIKAQSESYSKDECRSCCAYKSNLTMSREAGKTDTAIRNLDYLATGSWNGGNLERWIGTESKNKTWDYLYKVREDLVKYSAREEDGEKVKAAWESFYTAEGSDFAWWLDSMPYDMARHFDDLLRLHLSNVYKNLERRTPEYLKTRIIRK